jgi:hypothetical protein
LSKLFGRCASVSALSWIPNEKVLLKLISAKLVNYRSIYVCLTVCSNRIGIGNHFAYSWRNKLILSNTFKEILVLLTGSMEMCDKLLCDQIVLLGTV